MTPKIYDDLKRDEGLRLTAYRDTRDIWTVGFGHAHVAPGTVWTLTRAEDALVADVAAAAAALDDALPWWRTLDDVRQDVMCEMAFNMGITTLLEFKSTLGCIHAGRYAMASADMLLSLWAKQVGARATRLAAMMKTGVRPARAGRGVAA